MDKDTLSQLYLDIKVLIGNIKRADALVPGFRPLACLMYLIERTHNVFSQKSTSSMQRGIFRSNIHDLHCILIRKVDKSLHDRIDILINKLYMEVR